MQNQAKQTSGKATSPSMNKMLIIALVVIVLLLNIVWTLLQGKIKSEMQGVNTEMANLTQRVAKVEQGGVGDLASLRAEFDAMKVVGDSYGTRLAALLKAEEEQLAAMKKEAETRQAWIEELKKLIPQEAAK